VVETDGQLKNRRDVAVAALLGAENTASPQRPGGARLHYDARLPSGHLSGGRRHAKPELRKNLPEPGARRELHALRRPELREIMLSSVSAR